MSQNITPDMLKGKIVFDTKDNRVGIITKIIRERMKKLHLDFLEVEFDKRIPIGFRDKVLINTRDAKILADGNVKVRFTKAELKVMAKEQELQKHPPYV